MRLLRVKQVYWGSGMHYREGKIMTRHNFEDSFTSFLLLLLDPKPANVWHLIIKSPVLQELCDPSVSLTSKRGDFLYLKQVNVLYSAYCRRENPSCTFSICFHIWQMPIMKPQQSSDHTGWQISAGGNAAICTLMLLSIAEASLDCSSCGSVGPYKLDPRSAGQDWGLFPGLAYKQPKGRAHQF